MDCDTHSNCYVIYNWLRDKDPSIIDESNWVTQWETIGPRDHPTQVNGVICSVLGWFPRIFPDTWEWKYRELHDDVIPCVISRDEWMLTLSSPMSQVIALWNIPKRLAWSLFADPVDYYSALSVMEYYGAKAASSS